MIGSLPVTLKVFCSRRMMPQIETITKIAITPKNMSLRPSLAFSPLALVRYLMTPQKKTTIAIVRKRPMSAFKNVLASARRSKRLAAPASEGSASTPAARATEPTNRTRIEIICILLYSLNRSGRVQKHNRGAGSLCGYRLAVLFRLTLSSQDLDPDCDKDDHHEKTEESHDCRRMRLYEFNHRQKNDEYEKYRDSPHHDADRLVAIRRPRAKPREIQNDGRAHQNERAHEHQPDKNVENTRDDRE